MPDNVIDFSIAKDVMALRSEAESVGLSLTPMGAAPMDEAPNGPRIYVVDVATRKFWVGICTTKALDLVRDRDDGHFTPQEAGGALSAYLSELMDSRTQETSESLESLSFLAAFYFSKTKTCRAAIRSLGECFSVVLLRYSRSDGVFTMRPVASAETRLWSADEVLAAVEHIELMDRENHPEWF